MAAKADYQQLFSKLLYKIFGARDTNPTRAYDLWAKDYDSQPGNLMLELDEEIFTGLLAEIDVKDRSIVDIGCGTGRHWKNILEKAPSQLTGYDVSEKMLTILQNKFPAAVTHILQHNKLHETADNTIDIVISTLAVAHIEKISEAFAEWDRVLKNGGYVIITDYHPMALTKGGKRTFIHNGRIVSVRNHIHGIEELTHIAGQLQWQRIRLIERSIDETVKHFYNNKSALSVYESFRGVRIIYGILFKKTESA
jgi:ubiquinone/menaquinone biosynthesis C-methylase UbiE